MLDGSSTNVPDSDYLGVGALSTQYGTTRCRTLSATRPWNQVASFEGVGERERGGGEPRSDCNQSRVRDREACWDQEDLG